MRNFVHLTVTGSLALCLAACMKVHNPDIKQLIVHSGEDITRLVNFRVDYTEFLLEAGVYTAMNGECIFRSNITIRRKDTTSEVRIIEPMQIGGNNNVIDGLTWDGDVDGQVRVSDPGTLAISGSGNTIRNCVFRNMRMSGHGTSIVCIGRLKKKSGQFLNTQADKNIIESCTFNNWGLRDEPKGSTKSSDCISVGEENEKGIFTGTVIRNNQFVNGPYKQYGYNAAVKIFNSVTMEYNLFYGGQECMEVKYGNSIIRGNVIHHFSGYNILANRSGRNNLYEKNTVYDVKPIDKASSSQGIMIWEAGNTVYRENLVYNCDRAGLILGQQTNYNSLMQFVLIEKNSFIGNATGISFNNLAGSPRHVIVVKNIFYGSQSASKMQMLSGFDPASIENYSENVFYNILNDSDSTSLVADPEFTDAAAGNYALRPNSPACGYGAIPCTELKTTLAFTPVSAYSDNIAIYPTKNKYIFHVGLVGLDVNPRRLEISADGKVLVRRIYPNLSPTSLKVFDNIDMSGQPAAGYMLKITTDAGVITRQITIE